MDVEDKLEETGEETIGYLAREYSEVFGKIRRFADSDLQAWFVVWELMRWWESEEAKRRKGPRPATGPQLRELKERGIRELADLSQKEAATLLGALDKAPEDEESAEKEPY